MVAVNFNPYGNMLYLEKTKQCQTDGKFTGTSLNNIPKKNDDRNAKSTYQKLPTYQTRQENTNNKFGKAANGTGDRTKKPNQYHTKVLTKTSNNATIKGSISQTIYQKP